MLALALQQKGAAESARRLMDQVSSLGWRDPTAQLWLLREALEQRRYDNAAVRGDALLRQRLYEEEASAALTEVAASPGGLPLLVGRLAANPLWRGSFFERSIKRGGEDRLLVLRLMELLRDTEAPAATGELRPLLYSLVDAGSYEEAYRAWESLRLEAPAPIASALAPRDASAPFEWQHRSLPGVTIASSEASETGSTIRAEGTVAGRLVEKMLILQPGRYQLTARADKNAPGDAASFRWEVRCTDGNALLLQTRAGSPTETNENFEVPANCGLSRFALVVDHQGPQPAEVALSEPVIRALR
jgi:hypothetical protein